MGGYHFYIQAAPEDFDKRLATLPDKLQADANKVHRANVFYCLEAMIMWFRVDTGRMRASFFPFMTKHMHNFMRSLRAATGKDLKKNSAAEAEGQAMGFFMDEPLYTQIGSNVEYVDPLDHKTGVFDPDGISSYRPAPFVSLMEAVYKFDEFTQRNWDNFFAQNLGGMQTLDQYLKSETGMGVNGEIDFGQPSV